MTGPYPGYPPPPYPAPPPGAGFPPPPPPPQAGAVRAGVRASKNPLLGRFALALAVLMAVVATVSVIPLATLQGQLVVSTGSTEIDSDLLYEVWMSSASAPMTTWLASMLGSLAAMIIGLIAAITARGRATGIIAIVVGVLTPVAWIACWIVVTLPALGTLG